MGAIKLAEEVSGWLKPGQVIKVADDVNDCVKNADLVVTATFTSTPVLKASDDLKKVNCHIMAVGAPRPDWAETEPQIWKESIVYVDSFAGANAEAGDLIQSECEVEDELGAFINQGDFSNIMNIHQINLQRYYISRWRTSHNSMKNNMATVHMQNYH